MLRKFLIVGLGGSGGKTVRYLKQCIEERFEEIGWDEGMPEGWQFLHIDTPSVQDSPVLPGSPNLLDSDEYLPLAASGINLETIVDTLKGKGEEFAGWLVDRQLMTIPIAMGAGQYRAVGRIIGLYYADHLKRLLIRKQQALMSPGAASQLDRLAAQFSGDEVAGEAPPPVVIVISSLAGGTGAGILTDVCDILRGEGAIWLDQSIGILYAADVFADLAPAARAGIQPNTAAAVAELLHGYFGDGSFAPPGGGAMQQRSGPAFPYLVGRANTKGVSFGDQTAVFRIMARCLSAVMTDRRIQDDFTVYMSANWVQMAGKFASTRTPWMLPSPRYRGALQAMGFAEVDLGAGRLRTYAQQRITRDAVEWLLRGHLKLAKEWPEFENATVEEVIEGLAGQAFTRFLNLCGLNERGQENNQILDAIAVPDAEIQATCAGVATEVHEAGRDYFGAKASVGEWMDFLVDEVSARRAGVLKHLEDRLRDACLAWVEDTPDRILGIVGETLAEQGARVALKLLSKTKAEMEHVRGELHAERQEQLTLAEYVRSDVSDAIGVSRGTLSAESESVSQALQAAIQSGIVHRYNAVQREMAASLAEDLSRGVIEPLTGTLGNAADGLRIAIEADRATAGSTAIEAWPRHEPRSDQRVPDSLKPGKSLKSVIDPDDFPTLFDDLTTRSSGHPGKVDAWRSVRRTVISGDAETLTLGRWIHTDSKWTASEWLTVDTPPSRASFTVGISRDDLLERSRAWLDTDGSAWKVFLSQGLRGYLSDEIPDAERALREERFLSSMESAFEAAEPLASVDLEILPKVHAGYELSIQPHTSPIPVRGLPVEGKVKEFLVGSFRDVWDNYQERVDQSLDQSERETRVAVYSSLGGALHPMVFESLNKPISDAWERERANSFLIPFWEARRSRLLWMGVPIPRPALQALVRGWFIGRLLGLIHLQGNNVIFETGDGRLSFETMLPVPGRRPVAFLANLLESLPLAIPVAVHRRQPEKFLRPYTQLIEWGSEPDTLDVDSFLWPSQVLSDWLEYGTAPGSRQPVVRGPDRPARREEAIKLLRKEINSYKRQAETDRSRDRTPRNAWLGIAAIIHKGLSEIVACLEDEETGDQQL